MKNPNANLGCLFICFLAICIAVAFFAAGFVTGHYLAIR